MYAYMVLFVIVLAFVSQTVQKTRAPNLSNLAPLLHMDGKEVLIGHKNILTGHF